MLDQLSGSTQSAADAANTASQNNLANTSSSLSNLISVTVYNTDASHANLIMDYINTNFANAEVTLANSTANSYNKLSTQAP